MTLQAEFTILRRGSPFHSRYVLDDEWSNDTDRETLLLCDVWAYRLKLSGERYKAEIHDEEGDCAFKVVYLDAERDDFNGDLESWGFEVNGQNTGDTYQDLRDVLDAEGFEIGDTLWVKFTPV